jgi:threonine dehydratase
MKNYPSLSQIKATADTLRHHVIRTPTLPYYGQALGRSLDPATRVWLKLELLQRTGSFKARGAINVLNHLSEEQRQRGVTAFSAGNHAIATAFAARAAGSNAKVVMPKTANPFRVETCRQLGAEIIMGESIAELISITEDLQQQEGHALVHPFEGLHTFEGTGTVGLELCEDAEPLDAVIVPIGGGGLIAGIASAVKQINPDCAVYGVEPAGARGMTDSLAAGAPLASVDVSTIADSLGAPMHKDLSFQIVQHFVDDVVLVSDEQLADTMRLIFTDLKLAVEPACAAAMCALLHPLKDRLAGKCVGLIMCGSNIDQQTFNRLTA